MLKTILVPVGNIAQAEDIAQQAAILAQAFSSQIHLLGIVQRSQQRDPNQFADPVAWNAAKNQKQTALRDVITRLEESGVVLELGMLDTASFQTLIRYVDERDFGLIVFSQDDDTTRPLMRDVLAHTTVPVFINRAQRPVQFRRILVPLDGSQRAEVMLPLITTLAQAMDATLLLAHIIKEPEMPRRTSPNAEDMQLAEQITARNRQETERYLDDLSERLPIATEIHINSNSSVAAGLHELVAQQGVDLVGLCAHGYSGQPKWPFGSITSHLIDYAATSLIVLQDLPHRLPAIETEASARHTGGR